MNVLQHALLTRLVFHEDESMFNKIIPYVLLPDAIMYYTEIPQLSHFEKSMTGDGYSYIEYPMDIFKLSTDYSYKNKESNICHLEPCYNPYSIGGEIDIDVCSRHVSHLNALYRKGVKLHLQQDALYRKFLRENINCDNEFTGVFQFNYTIMSHTDLPSILEEIEQWGIYVLAYMLDKCENILIPNQNWFEDVVISKCFSTYPYLMAEYVYKTNVIRKDIDSYIKHKDWSHFDEMPIPFEKYEKIYNEMLYVQSI